MGVADFWKPGDYNVRDDRTGFKQKRSQCVKQWDNVITRKQSAEPRHPQDFIRARADRQQVPDPRTGGETVFLEVDEVQASDL